MSDLLLAFGRLLLDHRVDRDFAVGEDARDVRQHAGPVLRPACAGNTLVTTSSDRQDRHVRQLVGLERQVRHAMPGPRCAAPRTLASSAASRVSARPVVERAYPADH